DGLLGEQGLVTNLVDTLVGENGLLGGWLGDAGLLDAGLVERLLDSLLGPGGLVTSLLGGLRGNDLLGGLTGGGRLASLLGGVAKCNRFLERMDDGLTLLNIILLAVAVGVFLKLRSVLGRRTGHERPPFDPYSQTGSVPEKNTGNDKVVTLPTRPREAGNIDAAGDPFAGTARAFRWRGVAEEGSPLAAKLDDVAAMDRSFTADGFLTGARMAYEMIVTAFAAGDRASLKPLLGDDVYRSFDAALAEREAKDLTVDQSFIGIDKAKITDAAISGSRVRITVAFR